jgi:hypothetical protein
MAIIQALFAAIFRSARKLLNTASRWAPIRLVGKVPQDRRIYLSAFASRHREDA